MFSSFVECLQTFFVGTSVKHIDSCTARMFEFARFIFVPLEMSTMAVEGGKCTVLAELSHTLGPEHRGTYQRKLFFMVKRQRSAEIAPWVARTLVCNRRNRQRLIGRGRPLARGGATLVTPWPPPF